jgi:RNA polymerase sigma-70 factor (ECF subfamily)
VPHRAHAGLEDRDPRDDGLYRLSDERASEDRPGPSTASGLVDHFFRHEYGRVVATLTRVFGAQHLEIVEDAVQSALMSALTVWVQRGRPDDPSAWLYRAAHNHVLDVLRRHAGRARILEGTNDRHAPLEAPVAPRFTAEVDDDLLRMLFVCCDEGVPQKSRLVLALKTLCGFGTGEIALRLFTTEANVHKRLARARDRLRELGRGTETPPVDVLRARLPSVHEVLYLLFNEGYLSSQPEEAIRRELCDEAIRLTGLLAEHPLGATPETHALLALMLLHGARLPARVDRLGRLLLLEEQDRGLWDRDMMARGARMLSRARAAETYTRYHAEAAIAAEHCFAPSFAATRWHEVADLYEILERIAPSPLHTMNRAVAIAEWQGPEAGLALLAAMTPPAWLLGFYLWDAVLGELHRRAGHVELARQHVRRALDAAPTDAERELLQRRLAKL